MENKLRDIINNKQYLSSKKNKGTMCLTLLTNIYCLLEKKEPNPNFSHAIVFVFDCSEIETFNIITDYIEAFIRVEESHKNKVKIAAKKTEIDYNVKKVG